MKELQEKLRLQLEQEHKIKLYMKVLIDKGLQMIKEVLALQLQIEQEHQKVVDNFLLNQVEEDRVT